MCFFNVPVSFTAEYLEKMAMFEAATEQSEQLDLEDIYELGLIYYHGVNSTSMEGDTDEISIIIESDRAKSSKYFRMIVKGQVSGKINQ
jgi:TPR repeat protein